MRTFLAIVGCWLSAQAAGAGPAPAVTFNRDVLPVLQKRCQECHRAGEIAPMALTDYQSARPWAKAIKAAVLARKMPPWLADPKHGHFANDRSLPEAEIQTLAAWADSGAAEGDAKDRPPAARFPEGWRVKPDIVVEMPKAFTLPATGTVNYKWVLVKTDFPEDMWVAAAEMRPGNPTVLHHGKVWVRPPGSRWMENAVPGEAYELETQSEFIGPNDMSEGNDVLGKFNPGLGPQDFRIDGAAKFVPKGSDLVFELHYTSNGSETTDQSKLGLVLARQAPQRRYFFAPGPAARNLVIQAGDANAEVVSEVTVEADNIKLVYAQPHMHVRGKDMQLRAEYPTGESEIFLDSRWDFHWQLGYEFRAAKPLPKGTRLIAISHFDNSPNNPANPDPKAEVWWGLQNWEEMSNCFIGVTMDPQTRPEEMFRRSGPSLLRPVGGVSGPTAAALDARR